MRVLCAVGARPPFPSIEPFLTASSLIIAIASMSSLGGGPEFSACLTNLIKFIVLSPFDFWWWAGLSEPLCLPEPSFHLNVERGKLKSTRHDIYFVDKLRYLTLGLPLQFRKPSGGLLHVGREIRHFLHLAKLDHFIVGSGAARWPFHRLFLRLDLNHPVSADNLLRLGEGSIGHLGLAASERDARAHRGRMEAIERERHSGFLQSFVVLHHGGNGLGLWHGARLGLLVSLGDHQHHESHRNCLLLVLLVFLFGAGVPDCLAWPDLSSLL